MSITLIAKNQTVDDILIHDLGDIEVPGSGQLNLTDVYSVGMIRSSDSLKDEITNDNILINDGTSDLTKNDSIIAVEFSEIDNMFFGKHFQSGESDGESSHTGDTNYTQKLRITTPSLPEGTYLIEWSYEYKFSDINNSYKGRVQINDTTTIHEVLIEPKDLNNWVPSAGFKIETAFSGVKNMDLDYGTDNSNDTAYIRRAKLIISRVS